MPRSNRDVAVVALCGSLREASRTRIALREALAAAREAGASATLLDLREYDLPPVVGDERDVPEAERLKERVAAADAVLLGTPTYHGSYAAPLKNALDYCGRAEFEGTTVGLLEVAGGSYPGAALDHLRAVSRTLNAWTLPLEVGVPDAGSTVRGGRVRDEEIRERIRRLGTELAVYAGVEEYPETRAAVDLTVGD